MVPVVFVVTLGGGNAYAAPPVNITVFGQASLIVLHRPKPLKKQYFFACSDEMSSEKKSFNASYCWQFCEKLIGEKS